MITPVQLLFAAMVSGVVTAFTIVILVQCLDWFEERQQRKKRGAFQGRAL